MINWINLTEVQQLNDLKELSKQKPQVIFKHSYRCSISSMIKNRLEKNTATQNIDFYFLDLINHRALSNKIADDFFIEHQSPQLLLIKNEKCIFTESHNGITFDDVVAHSL